MIQRKPTTARIALPPKLIPVFSGPAFVRGARGGRGSGKTMSFALMTAVRAHMFDMAGRSGVIVCGREYLNSIDDSSKAEVEAAILEHPWLADHFDIGAKYIRTRSGNIEYKFSGLDKRTIMSLKSKAKILILWADEAEPITKTCWDIVLPTLRQEDSELWVTWNPARKNSETDKRFYQNLRANPDPLWKVETVNWADNPRFPEILNKQRLKTLQTDPDSYAHIWEGDYVSSVAGSYFVKQITQAKLDKRMGFGKVHADPLLTKRAFVDIGGTGKNADAFVIWIAQFVGKEVRIVDYYEVQGQPIEAHLLWLRERGHTEKNTTIILPHDGETHDRVFDVSYESAFGAAGYETEVIPNQGRGAAISRINAARRMFPACLFSATEEVQSGIEALAWYHEKRDEERDIGLGPEHDWASHASDAFGLMGVYYEDYARPRDTGSSSSSRLRRSKWSGRRGSAMAA